jgi:hypothetical protein
MTGEEFCAELKGAFGTRKDADLARLIGVTPGRISQLSRSKAIVGAQYAAKLIAQIANNQTKDALSKAISPIVEFFEITKSQVRENGRIIPFSMDSEDGKHLYSHLRKASGLYSFYNSQAEIIYFGKTEKSNLYAEIVNAYNRKLPNYILYRVNHPSGRFKPRTNTRLRQISKSEVKLCDTAVYFSAYSVSDYLIGGLEALFIRIVPNDIINVKMEKSTLKAFPEPEF